MAEIWFDDMIEQVQNFDVDENIEEVVNEHEDEITIYNKQQLFNKGQGADGSQLKEYASATYAKYKNKKNPNPGLGIPDIKLTGETYDRMFAKMDKNTLEISSTTDYTPKLEESRPNIFGLDEQSEDLAGEQVIEPELQKKLRDKIGVELV